MNDVGSLFASMRRTRRRLQEEQRELFQLPPVGGGRSSLQFIGAIVPGGPDDEEDFTNGLYWVRQVVSTGFDGAGVPQFDYRTKGRWVKAFNLAERGMGDDGAGIHALRPAVKPARVDLWLQQFVVVDGINSPAGICWLFHAAPVAFVPESFYLDVTAIDGDGCPDTYHWWQGYAPFAFQAVDSPPA